MNKESRLIAGGHRLAACKLIGLEDITVNIVELERIYGVRNGSANEKGDNRISQSDNLTHQKTQVDLANDIGISKQQLSDYKKLLTLIPEFQELIETGEMNATVGHKIWAKLPQEEQSRLVEKLGKDKIA